MTAQRQPSTELSPRQEQIAELGKWIAKLLADGDPEAANLAMKQLQGLAALESNRATTTGSGADVIDLNQRREQRRG